MNGVQTETRCLYPKLLDERTRSVVRLRLIRHRVFPADIKRQYASVSAIAWRTAISLSDRKHSARLSFFPRIPNTHVQRTGDTPPSLRPLENLAVSEKNLPFVCTTRSLKLCLAENAKLLDKQAPIHLALRGSHSAVVSESGSGRVGCAWPQGN